MRLECLFFSNPDDIPIKSWDVTFIGDALDDRGDLALKYVAASSRRVIKITYDPDSYQYYADGQHFERLDGVVDAASLSDSRVLLETTTLGFAETFKLVSMLWEIGALSFLYIEPGEYFSSKRNDLFSKRSFELTEESSKFFSIVDRVIELREDETQKGIFVLGYEYDRLERFFEQFPMVDSRNCDTVIGFPAFKPGWELNAFSNNIDTLVSRNISNVIHYAAANNPVVLYAELEYVYKHLGAEQLFLVPIGTKPHGIAVAIFAAIHEEVGLIYDFPRKKYKRTSSIGKIHLYRLLS